MNDFTFTLVLAIIFVALMLSAIKLMKASRLSLKIEAFGFKTSLAIGK